MYKTTDFWHTASERSIRWDDPEIGVEWPLTRATLVIVGKDKGAGELAGAEVFG